MAGIVDGFCYFLGDYLIAESSKHWKRPVGLNSFPKHGRLMKISPLESLCYFYLIFYALCFGEK